MITDITPVILTYDEEPNIARALERLSWARDIVIVDSGSTDRTRAIAEAHPRVRFFERPFDDFASQWNYALTGTGIRSAWVLALDADYILSQELIDELVGLSPAPEVCGYRASFVYYIDGSALRGSLYPSSVVLFRRDRGRYEMDGHAYRLRLEGEVGRLKGTIGHDDRKPASRWKRSQWAYARQEALKLSRARWAELSWADRLRLVPFASVPAVTIYCGVIKGLFFQGRAGRIYSGQRIYAEVVLGVCRCLRLIGRGEGP
ncbi:MAG: hypothetical protein MOGMAGMI_00459 [Candidatus Omnitrophica bacterium]|nr:hypothetical protein [Candidatus Omnitrophota bacterium]